MAWVALVAAGLFETAFAVCLKLSNGLTVLWPTIGFAISALTSFGLLTLALNELEVGPAYAVWTGIGAAGAATVGMVFLGGQVFQDKPWVGLLVACGGTIAISAAVEGIRRLRGRSRDRSAQGQAAAPASGVTASHRTG